MPARARLARSIARVEALPLPWRPSLPQVHPRAWLARCRADAAVARNRLRRTGRRARRLPDRARVAALRDRPDRGQRRLPAGRRARFSSALASLVGRPLVGLDGSAVLRDGGRASDGRERELRPRLPAHAAHHRRAGAPGGCPAPRLRQLARLDARARDGAPPGHGTPETPADLDLDAARRCGPVPSSPAAGAATAAHAVGLAGASRPASGRRRTPTERSCSIFARASRSCSGTGSDIRLKVAVADRAARRAAVGLDVRRRQQPGPPGVGDRSAAGVLTSNL